MLSKHAAVKPEAGFAQELEIGILALQLDMLELQVAQQASSAPEGAAEVLTALKELLQGSPEAECLPQWHW